MICLIENQNLLFCLKLEYYCHRMKPVIIEFLIYLQIILFLNKTNYRLDFLCLALINQSTQVFVKKNFRRVAVYILVPAIYRNIDTIMRHTLFTTILLYIPLRYIGPDVNLSLLFQTQACYLLSGMLNKDVVCIHWGVVLKLSSL